MYRSIQPPIAIAIDQFFFSECSAKRNRFLYIRAIAISGARSATDAAESEPVLHRRIQQSVLSAQAVAWARERSVRSVTHFFRMSLLCDRGISGMGLNREERGGEGGDGCKWVSAFWKRVIPCRIATRAMNVGVGGTHRQRDKNKTVCSDRSSSRSQ